MDQQDEGSHLARSNSVPLAVSNPATVITAHAAPVAPSGQPTPSRLKGGTGLVFAPTEAELHVSDVGARVPGADDGVEVGAAAVGDAIGCDVGTSVGGQVVMAPHVCVTDDNNRTRREEMALGPCISRKD